MRTGSLRPGRNTSSKRLARLADADVFETELLEHAHGDVELALAAVDHEQVRRVREPLARVRAFVALAEVVAEPAGEHLFHRREVVLVVERLHLEAAVVGALGDAVFHHDHRRDDLGALDVRDVEALDAQRRLGQTRAPPAARRARGRARCDPTRAAACAAGTLSRALSIAVSSSSRLPPRCGTRMRTLEPRLRREELLVELEVLGLDRHEDLLGHVFTPRVGVELLDDPRDERRRLDVFDLVDDQTLAAHHAALAHEEQLHARFERVLGERR